MTEKEIIKYRAQVNRLIDDYRINEAIAVTKSMASEARLYEMNDKLNRIEETYRYMLHYLIEGVNDSSRETLLADIKEQLRSIADLTVRAVKSKENPEYYYSLLRFNNFRNERVSDLLEQYGNAISELTLAEAAGNDTIDMRKRSEQILERLFNTLFTSYGADSDYADLYRYLSSGYSDISVAAQSLSALTLSLLQYYDKSKLTTLLDIYENTENDNIAARSLIGIIFALMFYPDRINSDAGIKARLYMWNDSIETYRRLRESIRVIVGTRDTQRVADKMKDEVIPELMKLRPDIIKSIKESNADSEFPTLENNPEWEEMLEKSGLNDKMRELTEMQSEGADLLMVTFSNLKQFPFFNSAANWFLPFDINNTALELDGNMRKFVSVMVNSGANVCDSDLYSLALAASRMPASQREMISSQMSAQFEQMNEELKSRTPESSTPKFDIEVLKVVRDLYRFFKLFRKKEGFKDPFERPLNFTAMPVIGEMMKDEDVLRLIGEFYFKRGYYADALPIFNILSETANDDSTLWEKIGFCYQSCGDYANARTAYDKAALLKVAGPWLTKKLAYVNRKLGNYSESAEYYQKALDMDPENLSLLMNVGNMLLETGDISGALQHFYHANYISPDNAKVIRAIAWVELLNGNFSKSADYYNRVITSEAQKSDFLNAGHAQLLLGHNKEALEFYRKSASDNREEFHKAFLNDLDTLVSLGLNRTTALLILDSINC